MASASVNPLGQSSLAKRLGWTFLLLCCYRIGVHVPIPGVDAAALAAYFKSLSGTLFDMFDMFSGGGLSNVSVFALGVMPYISASIIMQLLQVVSPDIKRMAKEEGQAGRRKITQYTRYLTVLITLVQGLFRLTRARLAEASPPPSGKAQRNFERIRQYLQENFRAPLTRESVAEQFQLHPGYLSRLFAARGENFSAVLRDLRMEHAALLLRNTELLVDEIADQCGYQSTTFFTAVFRSRFGIPPGQYRCLHPGERNHLP